LRPFARAKSRLPGAKRQGESGTMPIADKAHAVKIVNELRLNFKHFASPIDPFELRPHLNDYFERIKTPMDLTTVEVRRS
jgi:hypothetical protein